MSILCNVGNFGGLGVEPHNGEQQCNQRQRANFRHEAMLIPHKPVYEKPLISFSVNLPKIIPVFI